uniref:High affinity interleukin-8 receptor B n=1 Tax=Callorhinchus milii TaxID=7868 RepID=K4G0L6_CALMI|nr:High affinity interleukin-8 receptor B [Callorhinchus milii]
MESQSFTLDNEDWGDVFANYSETYSFDQGAVPCAHSVNTESVNTAMAVIYSLVCLLAMAGNVLVVIVILHNRRTMSSTDIYLLHLAIADVLFAITLPFSAADVINGWLFGDAMCKIVSVLKEVNFYSGILLLACISIDRFLAIVYSARTNKLKNQFLTNVVCGGVWLFAILLSLPILVKGVFRPPDSERILCYEVLDGKSSAKWRVATRFLRHIAGFLIPLSIMLFCYSVTINRVLKTKGFQKQKAMKVIIAVVLAFLICWLPYNITVFIDTLIRSKIINETCEMRNPLDKALFATESLGFLHSCINPILYAFIGVKFKRNLIKILVTKGIIKQGPIVKYGRSVSTTSESGLTSTTI